MTIEKLHDIHTNSIYNKEDLQNVNKCGCFYCLKIYDPKEIKEWLSENNGKETALCPYCYIDSVIPESDEYELSEQLLKEMYDYWM